MHMLLGETAKVLICEYKCTSNSEEQSPSKEPLSAQEHPWLGELSVGVLCLQPCSELSRDLQESALQQPETLLHLLNSPDVHHGTKLPSAGKADPQVTT